MDYPIYDSNEAYWAPRDGAQEITEFNEFINQLIDEERWETEVEKGILLKVKAEGTKALVGRQMGVLEIVIKRYAPNDCAVCGEPLPWDELIDSEDRQGMCSYHASIAEKERISLK